MITIKASCYKSRGFMYIPEKHLEHYKSPRGHVMDKMYEILAYSNPGFYLGWDFMIYMAPSKRVFLTSAGYLSKIKVHKDTGVLLHHITEIPVKFFPVPLKTLYSDLFSS